MTYQIAQVVTDKLSFASDDRVLHLTSEGKTGTLCSRAVYRVMEEFAPEEATCFRCRSEYITISYPDEYSASSAVIVVGAILLALVVCVFLLLFTLQG